MRRETALNEMILSQEALKKYYSHGGSNSDTRRRMKELLRKAVQHELTDRQKECIILFYYENKSVKEIAGITGIKPTTVYKHLKKGRNALRRCTIYL